MNLSLIPKVEKAFTAFLQGGLSIQVTKRKKNTICTYYLKRKPPKDKSHSNCQSNGILIWSRKVSQSILIWSRKVNQIQAKSKSSPRKRQSHSKNNDKVTTTLTMRRKFATKWCQRVSLPLPISIRSSNKHILTSFKASWMMLDSSLNQKSAILKTKRMIFLRAFGRNHKIKGRNYSI